jgi:GT2 family glycosyltransferase
VRVIELPENIGAPARNVGVEAATTPYVAFADDDSWWSPGTLEAAADVFDAHPRLGLVQGTILVGTEERLDPACEEMSRSPLDATGLPGPGLLGFVACGAIVRREAYLEAGGFDPVVFFPGEEERLSLDLATAGWGMAYVSHLIAHHHPSPVRDDDGRRRSLIVRNRLLTAAMRRPWRVVFHEARRALADDAPARRGVWDAARRAPRALAARRVVPAHVEEQLRLLS